jgi:hypothetical protein
MNNRDENPQGLSQSLATIIAATGSSPKKKKKKKEKECVPIGGEKVAWPDPNPQRLYSLC